jgi:hypothetical protein
MYFFDTDILLDDLGNSRFTGAVSDNWSVNGNPKVLSRILCEIAFCQFCKIWQVVRHFSYGF